MAEELHQGIGEESDPEEGDSEVPNFRGGGARVRRYPIHDSVEFEDVQNLRNLIFVPKRNGQEDDDDEDDDDEDGGGENEPSEGDDDLEDAGNYVKESSDEGEDDEDSAVTDVENDNAAVAAAVYGHPPLSSPSRAGLEDTIIQSSSFTQTSSLWEVLDHPAAATQCEDQPANLTMATQETVFHQDIELIQETIQSKKDACIMETEEPSERSCNQQESLSPAYHCPYDLDERDDDENTPLHIATHCAKLEHMRLLLQAGASPHRKCDGSAPIHTAISIGAIPSKKSFALEAVKLLHQHDADLGVFDDANHTPLYLAVARNLTHVVNYILSDPSGAATLNLRSDRVGGRPLHAAAKFDVTKYSFGASSPNGDEPGGTRGSPKQPKDSGVSGEKFGVAQILTLTPEIEINPTDNYGKTPLHIACGRGNWGVARLLIQAGADPKVLDKRGFTPAGLAYKRGMTIPSDLVAFLGLPGSGIPRSLDTSNSSSKRDLIMDPDGRTLIICHELCSRHFTCPPISRDGSDVPPENIRRLSVLLNEDTGILRSSEFERLTWEREARRAAMVDVLKCHDYSYIEKISQLCSELPDHPRVISLLDPDTSISRWTFESALRAAGSVCEAVDRVMAGDFRNVFCAVRPPGHHAGPTGVVKCANDPEGSHGFCILNNVAIGAAYARSMYRNDGIKKIAIVDFDVHHGNGTEAIVRSLLPTVDRATIKTSFVTGVLEKASYRPWLDETDIHNVFFASVHGYGPRDASFSDHPQMGGWFYPASGKSSTSDAVLSPSNIETPRISEFMLSQTWTRMGETARSNCCKVINVGLNLPKENDIPGMQRVEMRDSYRKDIIPHLLEFNPDIIFISAGFDAHKRDSMNFGYVGMVEDDYEWLTEQLVKVANTCCNGRIISVLEGGYKIHGGIVSPFARSVASHVRALVDGGSSRALYDSHEAEWESRFELEMVIDRERKKKQKLEKFFRTQVPSISMERRRSQECMSASMKSTNVSGDPMDLERLMNVEDEMEDTTADAVDSSMGRKRKRTPVDYKELYDKMKREGEILS